MPRRLAASLLAPLGAFSIVPAAADEFQPLLEELARGEIARIVSAPEISDAIRAQNVRTGGLGESEIRALDADWRAQIGTGRAPLIDAVTSGPLAERLRAEQEASTGLFTEIFVMDRVGLNVAASAVTSDYWQGDEAKWQETFAAGPGAVHISDIEFDESSQSYQSQVSVAITDPETGAPIGAATFGVAVEYLQ
ncbi:MAG: hypothetical protein ACFBSD_07880 [Paracoccaceae bacterium]